MTNNQSNYAKISAKLLTTQEMSNTYVELNKINYEFPYFYKIVKNNQCLYFVGAHHSFDPQNEQFPKIHSYWNSFLAASKDKERVVLVEGGNRPVLESESEPILAGGEAHLLAYLANSENIECYSPEPSDINELLELEKSFTKEEIMYNRFARTAAQWGRLTNPKPDFEDYIKKYLSQDIKLTNWDIDISLRGFSIYHDSIHNNHEFSIQNCLNNKCFYNDSNPSINRVSAESGKIRDIFIGNKILYEWSSKRCIFIVYGSGHAIVLERALKELLGA